VPSGVVHKLPADLREALIANATALAAWKDITPLARSTFRRSTLSRRRWTTKAIVCPRVASPALFPGRGGHWALPQRASFGALCAALGPLNKANTSP
jgi:hypothetical protein